MITEALELAGAGWPIFPLAGKMPAIPKAEGGRGFHDATTDLDLVGAWCFHGDWDDVNHDA